MRLWWPLLLLPAFLAEAQPGPYWAHGYGGVGDDRVTAIAQGPGVTQFVCGTFSGTMYYPGGSAAAQGVTDVFVACVDTGGTVLWMRTGGGPGPDRATDVAVDAQGRVSFTGQFSGSMAIAGTNLLSSGPSQDMFLARYAADGTPLWARSGGGPQNADIGERIAVDDAGRTWVAGQYSHAATFGGVVLNSTIDPTQQQPGIDVFITCYDADGVVLWARGAQCEREEAVQGLAVDDAGNAWVAGRYSQTITFDQIHAAGFSNAAFLVKLNGAGAEQAFRRISGGTSVLVGDLCWAADTLWMVGSQTGNNLVFAGSQVPIASAYAHSAFVLAFGNQAQLLAQRTIGNASGIRGCALHVRGGEVLVGGDFACQADELSAWAGGNGLFLSWGAENTWVAILRRSDLAITYAQMLADRGGLLLRGLVLDATQRAIAVGEFEDDLYVPAQEGRLRALPGDSLIQVAGLFEACGDTTYYDVSRLYARGVYDGFLTRGFIRDRPPLDIFDRSLCTKDLALSFSIVPASPPTCNDPNVDLAFCGEGVLQAGFNYTLGPGWTVEWNDGQQGAQRPVLYTGTHAADGIVGQGCFSAAASVSAGICPAPPRSGITDNIGINEQDTLATDVEVCLPAQLQLTAGPLTTDTWYWSSSPPDTAIIQTQVFTVPSSGPWALYAEAGNGCTSATPIVVNYLPGQQLGTAVVTQGMSFPMDTDGNDTISLCDFASLTLEIQGSVTNNGVTLSENGGFQVRDTVFALPGGPIDIGVFSLEEGVRTIFCPYSGDGWYRFMYILGIGDGPCHGSYARSVLIDSVYVQGITGQEAQVDIVGSIFLCDGDTVTLTAQTQMSGSFQWVASNGGILGPADSTVIRLLRPGFVTVQFMPMDTGLCVSGDADEHSVQYVSPPTITMDPPDGLICPGAAATLTVTGASGTYAWYGPGGPLPFNTAIVQVSEPGTYFGVMNTWEGCAYATGLRTVSVYGTPFISADDAVLCPGGSVTVQVQPAQGADITWASPLSGQAAVQTITAPGTYTCSVTLCGSTTPLTFTVQESTVEADVLTPGPYVLCAGDSLLLQAAPGLAAYTWQPGNVTDAGIWAAAPGTYELVGFNADGCTDTAAAVVVSTFVFSQALSTIGDTVCIGDTLQLTASAGGALTWFADAELQQPVGQGDVLELVLPPGQATYYVVQEESGCTSDPVAALAVVEVGGSVPVVTGDTLLCAGEPLQLSAGPGSSMLWTTPAGTFEGASVSIGAAGPELSGPWSVAGQLGPCATDTATVQVQVNDPVVQPVEPGPLDLCPGDSVLLAALPGLVSYTWSPAGIDGATLLVGAPGPYQVIGTDALGCADTSAIITVVAFNYAQPLSATAETVCTGQPITAAALGSGAISWFADADLQQMLGTGSTFNVASVQPGDTLYVVQSEGPCTTGPLALPLEALPVPPVPVIAGDPQICAGDALVLSVPALFPATWTTPAGTINGTEVRISPAGPGDSGAYTVLYTDTACAGGATAVEVLVAVPDTISLGADTTICIGEALTLSAEGWSTVLWSDGGSSTSVQAGPGIWWVAVTDENGCAAADTVVILGTPCVPEAGNVFTPNGDGVNDVLTFTDPAGRMLVLTILNRWGQVVFSRSAPVVQWDGRNGFSGEVLPEGVYYYTLELITSEGMVLPRTGYLHLVR